MSESEGRTPRWLSALLVLIALGGLGFAIYRYVEYEQSKPEPEPPPPPGYQPPMGAPVAPQLPPIPDKAKNKK